MNISDTTTVYNEVLNTIVKKFDGIKKIKNFTLNVLKDSGTLCWKSDSNKVFIFSTPAYERNEKYLFVSIEAYSEYFYIKIPFSIQGSISEIIQRYFNVIENQIQNKLPIRESTNGYYEFLLN